VPLVLLQSKQKLHNYQTRLQCKGAADDKQMELGWKANILSTKGNALECTKYSTASLPGSLLAQLLQELARTYLVQVIAGILHFLKRGISRYTQESAADNHVSVQHVLAIHLIAGAADAQGAS